jgi:hypothetical protein
MTLGFILVLKQACKSTEKGRTYYEFRRNTRSVKSTISHFQVSALTSAHVHLAFDYYEGNFL